MRNDMHRREFFASIARGAVVAGAVSSATFPADANESASSGPNEQVGVLVDTTKCIGCRKCEYACARANRSVEVDIKEFDDVSVFDAPRRMTPDSLTVVNRYVHTLDPAHPVYVKIQCMHCVKPCCVSACIVGRCIGKRTVP